MTDSTEYLKEVIGLVINAGDTAMDFYEDDYRIDAKQDDSPVTEADLGSERILLDGLKNTKYGIIAEEAGFIKGEDNTALWVVDPLDGTQDFIDKTGEFSIMVGLLSETGKPIMGVVYAPVMDKLWYGIKGNGSRLVIGDQHVDISVSDKPSLQEFQLIASRNHFSETDRGIAKGLNINGITRMGRLGVKFCSIAEGEADLTYYTTDRLGIWDCCAPHIILEEAGGTVLTVAGNVPEYDLDLRRMPEGVVGLGSRDEDLIDSVIQTLGA